MRTVFLIFFLLFSYVQPIHAQSVYYTQRDDSWKIKYVSAARANPYTNLVLKQLGLAHLKIPEQTSFTFFFNYGVSVGFQQGTNLEVTMSLMPSVCTGDVQVGGFDLQQILVPSTCSFRIYITDPLIGEVYSIKKSDVPLTVLLAGDTFASFPDSLWSAGCRAGVEFTGFGFDAASYKNIEKELYAIRDYNAAVSLSDTLGKRIRILRKSTFSADEFFRSYVLFSKGLCLLREAENTRTSIVPGSDPGKLNQRLAVVEYQFRELLGFLNRDTTFRPFSGNVYLTFPEQFGKALFDAMALSQKTDYYSSPFFYRLFSNSTTLAQLKQSADFLNATTTRHVGLEADFKRLSLRIADEYCNAGEKLMDEGRYAEAIDLLKSGKKFCSLNPAVFVPVKIEDALRSARTGLTDSYMRIVRKALDNNLTSLAEKYLAEAMNYIALNNNLSEADSTGFASLFEVLSGKDTQKGNKLLASGHYHEALGEFDRALETAAQFNAGIDLHDARSGQLKALSCIFSAKCTEASKALKSGNPEEAETKLSEALEFAGGYPDFKPDMVSVDSLHKGIAGFEFNSLLKLAKDALAGFDNTDAVGSLMQAAALRREFQLASNALFDTLVTEAALPAVHDLLSEARLKLWGGEPDKALRIAGDIRQMLFELGLNGRPEVAVQYAELMDLADKSVCSRFKGELTSLISQASDSYVQNKFDEGDKLVFDAREMIYARSACGLTTQELNAMIARFEHKIRWHNMITRAAELIDSGTYLNGAELLQQAGAVYTYYRLDTLGLVNTGLYDLALRTTNASLLRYAVGFYTTRGEYDRAFNLLDRMRLMHTDAAETADLQDSLARGMAGRDAAENNRSEVKILIRHYTGGDKWYRRFGEVYRYHFENR